MIKKREESNNAVVLSMYFDKEGPFECNNPANPTIKKQLFRVASLIHCILDRLEHGTALCLSQ